MQCQSCFQGEGVFAGPKYPVNLESNQYAIIPQFTDGEHIMAGPVYQVWYEYDI